MDSPPSQPTLLALSLVLLLLALYLARRRRGAGKNRGKYPPVAGTVLHQLLNFGRLVEYQTELSRRHRTFRMLTPTCNYIYTVEPANVEYILKSNFANYGKGSTLHGLAEDLLGDGIFVVDGDRWRHQRKVASHEFSTRVLREFSSAVFRDTAAELAGIVAAADGERLEISDLLMRSTLDSIFKVGFGVSLGSLSGCSEEGAAFARAFDDASEQVLYRLFDVFWKAKRLLNISSEAAMKRSLRTINDFIYAVIDRKIEQMGKDQQEFATKEDILSRFLLEREQDPDCFDNKYLRDIILSFVTAGRDTTAGTLSWFLYVLCRNEAVQDRIVEEVRAATAAGGHDVVVGAGELAKSLTEDAIGKMHYLHAALTETLRLFPAVPVNVKCCFSDDTLPDGYAVNKGDMVHYQPFPMGRMEFLWGADAEEFRPERWLDDDGVFVPESPFKFTAFQAGPRVCLGREFAYRQMKIFAALLLSMFRFEMWDADATVGYRAMLTLKMDRPLCNQTTRDFRTVVANLAPRHLTGSDDMESPLSEPAMLALCLLVLLLAVYFVRRRRGPGKHRGNYPPVAGTVLHQLLNFGRLVEYQTELARRYRTFRMLTPTCNYVYTVEPANVEYMLKTNFSNYGKGVMTHDVLEDLLGDGIFNVDGAKWRHQRKVASHEFSTRVLREFSSAVFRDTAAELAGIVVAAAAAADGERAPVDITDLLMRSTLDSIFKIGFGVNLGSLSGCSKEGAAFARAFDDASEQVLYRFFDVFWKVKRLLNISSEAAMKRSVRTINEFVYAVIDRKIEQMARNHQEFAKKEDILSRFLLEREQDPGCFDNKYLRDIILNFVIAGRDTTAGTMAWFLYVLCRNQHIQEKIAREVRVAATGDRDVGVQEFVACLTEDAISKMQYLHAALTETLRLYPAVPIDVKYCFSDDTLPDGYAVRKGDMVNYQPYPMGRMKFLWGMDAEEFRPERWLDDDGVFVPESPFKFTAFQAGPRICLGKEFAYRQMKIFAAVLLYLFRFEMWDANAKVGYRPMLTLKMDGPLYVRASPRR
nr:unnamed protein product [Digitaria exilis]